jgi:hypothetical protein
MQHILANQWIEPFLDSGNYYGWVLPDLSTVQKKPAAEIFYD